MVLASTVLEITPTVNLLAAKKEHLLKVWKLMTAQQLYLHLTTPAAVSESFVTNNEPQWRPNVASLSVDPSVGMTM